MNKIDIGTPFNTQAIINFEGIRNTKISDLPQFLKVEITQGFKISFKMDRKDIVYGLGENVRGINKRGGIYESFCSDDFTHTPDKKSLYAAHNFLVVDGDTNFGLFIDHPGLVTFDIGYTHKDELVISGDNPNFSLYFIPGDSSLSITKKFRTAIGLSFIPPKWAFGYQQSRWSYPDAESIENIGKEFRNNEIPCDTIYLDIDYMEDFKNFTVDNSKFPNFKEFVAKMKGMGIRLIPIIDAGCKIEKGYPIYEEGIEKGYYCVDKEGKPFVGAVWPGKVHFPDFLNENVGRWFGQKYDFLINQGIEGFWNDMNEPAIFYSEAGLKKAMDKVTSMAGQNLDIYSFFDLKSTMESISNNIDDYKSFYHNVNGKLINHYDLHNLYGYFMTKSAGESFINNHPDKRILLFSRASYVGMHRYGGIWTGDNKSWWEHLLLNIQMMPSVNMEGFLYSGADVGGFGSNSDSELVTRWTQFGIFTPLFRNHAALGTRKQEPFSFDIGTTNIIKNTIQLRYALIPYIYSEYMKAALNNDMYFKPLGFVYTSEQSKRIEDQLLVGDSIMVAPVYTPNSFGRNVWVPEDMLLWKVKTYKNRNFEVVKEGFKYIDLELDETPIFIRKNKMLVVGNHGNFVSEIDNSVITLIAYTDDEASYELYDDDGVTHKFRNGEFSKSVLKITANGDNNYSLSVKGEVIGVKTINYIVVNSLGAVYEGNYSIE
ncbi:MAG: DUF5110 domain-containing protein [Spirochaetales bacterium]|nr:DUF5110 domain-containing protein [Spirochaetales bacterium]